MKPNGQESMAAVNKGLAKVAVQWLIEVLCFYFTFVLADSLVLRNARHRQAPKRYAQLLGTLLT